MITNKLNKLISIAIITAFFFTNINIGYAIPDSKLRVPIEFSGTTKTSAAQKTQASDADRAPGQLSQEMLRILALQSHSLTPKLKAIIQAYGLLLDKTTFTQVSGPLDDKLGNPLEDQVLALSLNTTNMAALASYFNAGCAIDPATGQKLSDASKRKKIADGGAVTILEKMLVSIAEDLNIAIIIGGSEGKTRDGAPALRVKQVINPNGKNGIYVMQTDPIENTNAQAENKSGAWSLFFLVKLPKKSEVDLRRHAKRTKKGLEEFLISISGSHLEQYNIPFCHDRYVVSVSYPGNVHADTSAKFHPANDSPMEILKAIAAEHNITFEELCEKAHIVFLGNRQRHDYIEKSLKDLQGKGAKITYTTVSDGDAFARIMASLGVPTNKAKEFTIVFGASGAVEAFATGMVSAGAAGITPNIVGRVKMVHSSKHLDMYDLTGWDQPNAEDLADFHALGITDPSTVLTEDDFSIFPERIFIGSSITGAREDVDISSNIKIGEVRIDSDTIVISSFVLDKYGRGFVMEVAYKTNSVASTRLSMVSDNNYGVLDDSARSVRDYMIDKLLNSSDLEENIWLRKLSIIGSLSEETKEWLRALLEMKKIGVKEFQATAAVGQDDTQVTFDIDSVIDNVLQDELAIGTIERAIVITEKSGGKKTIVEAKTADGSPASIEEQAILFARKAPGLKTGLTAPKHDLDLRKIMETNLFDVNPEILSGLIAPDDLLITSIRISAYQEMIDRGVPQDRAFQIAKGIMRSLFDEDCELMASASLVEQGEGNAIGVKVGGTSFKAAVVEPSGQIIAKGDKREWKTITGKEAKDLSAEQVADLLSEGVIEIIGQHRELKSQGKINIGISLPGQTENTEGWGRVASFGSKTPNVPFYNTALSDMIEARLAQAGFDNVKVSLMNDSFARLMGELSQNGTLGRNGWRSGTTVISGTGVNASMAVAGRPFTDERALTELGNVVVAPLRYDPLEDGFQNQAYDRRGLIPRDDELARDGLQRLEVLINGSGLADLARLFGFSIPGHESALPDAEGAALEGDKKALKLIEIYGRIVGKGLASIASEQNGYEQMWAEHTVLVSGVFERFARSISVPDINMPFEIAPDLVGATATNSAL